MIHYEGKWALITGASAGIGEKYAIELAKKKTNLILVARREDRLKKLADELQNTYQIKTEVIVCDLSKLDAPQELYSKITQLQLPVHILINNAGFGVYGKLHGNDLHRNQEQILVNVHALTSLTQLFLPAMVKNQDGIIINLASVAAFQPLPHMAVYGATKAFVLSFTEALWAEYQHSGIRILAVCPGPVETEFFSVMGGKALEGNRDTPDAVVKETFSALEKNKIYVIPGKIRNYVLANLNRLTPRSLSAKITERMLRERAKDMR